MKSKQQRKDEAYEKYKKIRELAYKKYIKIQQIAYKKYLEKAKKIDSEENIPEEIIEHNGHKYKLVKEPK